MLNTFQVVVNVSASKDAIAVAKSALELSSEEFDLLDVWFSGSGDNAYLISFELETNQAAREFEEKEAVSFVERLDEE